MPACGQQHPLRARLISAGCALAILIFGVAVRTLLPVGFWTKYTGVALWSALLYALLVAAAPQVSVVRIALATLAVSWAVEFLQLAPFPAWLAARQPIFAWVFGTSFSPWDLPAYAVGIILAAAIHALLIRAGAPQRTGPQERPARR